VQTKIFEITKDLMDQVLALSSAFSSMEEPQRRIGHFQYGDGPFVAVEETENGTLVGGVMLPKAPTKNIPKQRTMLEKFTKLAIDTYWKLPLNEKMLTVRGPIPNGELPEIEHLKCWFVGILLNKTMGPNLVSVPTVKPEDYLTLFNMAKDEYITNRAAAAFLVPTGYLGKYPNGYPYISVISLASWYVDQLTIRAEAEESG
jgi:hypothetical protein